ncbi:MAG TPA: hypothetical protein VFE45_10815, partial [Coriobacteriia bacterium]|nr:hypothetical protein [Coriobacteriia bacterium]
MHDEQLVLAHDAATDRETADCRLATPDQDLYTPRSVFMTRAPGAKRRRFPLNLCEPWKIHASSTPSAALNVCGTST